MSLPGPAGTIPPRSAMRKLSRMIGATFGALILATTGVAAIATPAQAAAEDCKTGTTVIKHRGDQGFGTDNGGVWAYTDRTSKYKICRVMPEVATLAEQARWDYRATIEDTGTFKTLAGDHLSPMKGEPLKVVEGTFKGGFTATFSALADFDSYNAKHYGKTYTGAGGSGGNPKMSEFVSSMFGADFQGSSFDEKGWGWTYTTGCESWTNATGAKGEDLNSGDITGKVCPTQEPTTPATPDPTAPPTVDPTAAPGAGGGLPVTGASVGTIAGGAALLLVVGGGLFFVARRRKVTFTA